MNCTPNSNLKIAQLNIHSINNKISELKHYLMEQQIDIMALNETWLNTKSKLNINGFDVVRKDRNRRAGGGVCLLIESSLTYTQVKVPSANLDNLEYVAIKLCNIINSKHDLIIATYYNPPQDVVSPQLVRELFALGEYVLLIGDLNAHHELWNSAQNNASGRIIEEILDGNNCSLLNVDQATFQPLHTPDYQAILDLAISSDHLISQVKSVTVTDDLRSDHLTTVIEIRHGNKTIENRNKPRTITVSKTNWEIFFSLSLEKVPSIGSMDSAEQLDNAAAKVTAAIQSSIDEATTTKTFKSKASEFMILPREIVNIIKDKRKVRRQFQKYRLDEHKKEFNRLAELVKKQIKAHKQSSWENFCNDLNKHQVSDGVLWRKLRSIENKGQQQKGKVPILTSNQQATSDPAIVSNLFADQLESNCSEPNDPSFDDVFKNLVETERPNFFNYQAENEQMEATPGEVSTTLKNLRTRGAPGPDKITNNALKRLPLIYSHIIADIVNASLKLGHIPKLWKEASVVMIPKPMKDHSKVENYRPISLLNTLSKVVERIVQTRILLWQSEKKLISKFQCGFRKKHQTRDHLLRIIQRGISSFNRREKMGAVFVDIEKAFDKIWHAGLLYQLNEHQIPSYLGKWLANYLSDRTFRIKCGNTFSTSRRIGAGVPQGSVLGPILFNIYINSITTTNDNKTELALFADDLASWVSSRSLKVIQLRLQNHLNKLHEWAGKWRMSLSKNKTVFCIFNKGCFNINNQIELKFGGAKINGDKNPKFLGVKLDPGLRLHEYAKDVKKRTQGRINLLKSIRGKNWGASPKLIFTTYKVLIRSIIDYAPAATLIMANSNQTILERIQRKAIRSAVHWPAMCSAKEMYVQIEKFKLPNIKARAIDLTDKYLVKAAKSTEIIKDLVDNYNELDEGIFSKAPPRLTVLGHLKQQQNLACSALLSVQS